MPHLRILLKPFGIEGIPIGPQVVGASLVGPGADSVTITIKDDDIPEPNVDVWIALNSNGTNVIAGTLTTQ
jgi:hypothetical protein